MFRITALTLGILALFYSINVKLTKKPSEVALEDDEVVTKRVKKVKKNRAPASVPKKVATSSPRNYESFRPEAPRFEAPEPEAPMDNYDSGAGTAVSQPSYVSSGYSYGGDSGYGRSSGRSYSGSSSSNSGSGSSSSGSSSSGSSTSSPGYFAGGGSFFPPSTPIDAPNNDDDDDDEDDDEDDTPTTDTSSLTCSSNKGGGAYANPIAVGLSCSASSQIKYCLSQGSCCDPKSVGTAYSSNIIVGAASGSYCLSFYGESSTLGKSSTVTQLNFTISNTLPDIQVTNAQTFYQTTQLSGQSVLRSNDFQKSNYEIGQISLKSHDPGPSGLNMTCGEIVTNYVALPAPLATPVMTALDMAGISLSQQVRVPFNTSHLIYGDNYITSYVVNKNFATPIYSCSTAKINLMDFEYFQADVSHSSPVVSNVREFSGEFTVYGFFEADETNVYRGPAGSSSEDQGGRSLKSGLFSIFF